MKQTGLILGIALLASALVCGCGRQEEPAKPQKPAASVQAAPSGEEAAKKEPLTKEQCPKPTAPETGQHQVYDEPDMPIRTEYPDNMTVTGSCSGEGCGFTFRFKDGVMDKAEAHIFLPRGAASAAAQERFVTGEHGLLETNGWHKESESPTSSMFPYAWVKKIIDFSDPGNKDLMGEILLGEAEGQAVQVILSFPGDRSKEFIANARIILGNLQFKSEQLPVGKAH